MQTSEGLTDLLLSFYDVRELGVGDPRVQLTFHQRRPLVIFDVSQVAAFRHFDVFGKPLTGVGGEEEVTERRARGGRGSRLLYLLLEVANGVLVSVGEEIEDVVFDVILLQVVHQVGSVALTFQNRPSERSELGLLTVLTLEPVPNNHQSKTDAGAFISGSTGRESQPLP